MLNTIAAGSVYASFVWLVISYLITGIKNEDFGNTPSFLKVYLLATAAAAFACMLAIPVVAIAKDVDESIMIRVSIYLTLYFLLQLGFIPSVRHGAKTQKKSLVRLLLLVCAVLIGGLYGTVLSIPVLSQLALFSLVHVTFNDLILYGALF